ncbi:hypothetical protein BHS06_09395 [Myxococcus xanthus]|uniref:hypothetical protein n=1 Tax=Myxococcus xanthus TaxID=34 RepID=UPI001163A25D|nr:hypothetical protein [Myxococcus xanthus]QDE89153.1 hypothetical protein BHS06_09395 [Myxococcus xanthus]
MPAQVSALATNRARHVLVTGTFEGSIDLGGGPLTVGEFLAGVFLAEFDASGRHVWSLAYPLEFFSFFGARKMLTDSHGNIAVTGVLRGAIYFDTDYIVADSAPVLLRFSPTGSYQWSYVESPYFGQSGGVATDKDDNLYMAGTIITDLYPPLDVIPFVNKFSPAGTRLWQRQLDTTLGYAQSVGVHGNRVVLTGTFMSPLSFGGQTFFPQHSQDGFVVALTRANEERWAKQLGREVLDVSLDHRDDLVVVGRYEDGDDLASGRSAACLKVIPTSSPRSTTGSTDIPAGPGAFPWPTRRMYRPPLAATACRLTKRGRQCFWEASSPLSTLGPRRSCLLASATCSCWG